MIDPDVLAKQRIGPARVETRCGKCGKRTTDATGVCSACKHSKIPDLTRLTNEHVMGLLDACRAELKRRRDELDAALGEP